MEYKKRHRPLKVVLLDESTRTCLIDSTKNVKKIVIAIGERLGLKNADEYALRKIDSPEGIYLNNFIGNVKIMHSDQMITIFLFRILIDCLSQMHGWMRRKHFMK